MKHNLKTIFFLFPLFCFLLTGCEENLRTEVKGAFFVNKSSLALFVGDEVQLIASPTDGTYVYRWSSDDASVATVDKDGLVKAVGAGVTYIIVKAGDLENRVEVTSVVKVPLESVELSESHLELLYGDKATVIATCHPENYNFSEEIIWYSENPDIARVEDGVITVTGEGVTSVVFQSGNIVERVVVDGKYTRPFKGPHTLSSSAPCEVPAANFDFGGEGFAFHDNEPENKTGNDSYRLANGDTRGTPVEVEGNGNNIGYTSANEWLVYTLNVEEAGTYFVEASVSANGNNARFHIEVNNENVTGPIHIPNNGSWSSWRWHPVPPLEIHLDEGEQRVKFYIEDSGFNFRALRFTKK
jgi:hypothetical protein